MAEEKKPAANGHIKEVNSSKLGIFSESLRDAKEHVVSEVLKPMIKNYIGQILLECANKAVEIIFGTKGRTYKDDHDRRDEFVSYSSYYKYGDYHDDRTDYAHYAPRYAYWDICFDTKAEADDVLNHLKFILQEEGAVDLGTFYEISGNKRMIGPQDFEWGWGKGELAGVEVRQRRNGMWYFANLRRVREIPKRR